MLPGQFCTFRVMVIYVVFHTVVDEAGSTLGSFSSCRPTSSFPSPERIFSTRRLSPCLTCGPWKDSLFASARGNLRLRARDRSVRRERRTPGASRSRPGLSSSSGARCPVWTLRSRSPASGSFRVPLRQVSLTGNRRARQEIPRARRQGPAPRAARVFGFRPVEHFPIRPGPRRRQRERSTERRRRPP